MLNQIAIIGVLAVIAYMLYTNVARIIANRREAAAKEREQAQRWNAFSQALDEVRENQKQFQARAGHLPAEVRTEMWAPVQYEKLQACYRFLARDFYGAMIMLTNANTKARGLLPA